MINWPGSALFATCGAWISISVVVSFRRSLRRILYNAVAPLAFSPIVHDDAPRVNPKNVYKSLKKYAAMGILCAGMAHTHGRNLFRLRAYTG